MSITPNFSASITSGIAPLGIDFTDLSIGDPIDYWYWDFGDGNDSEDQNPTNVYSDPGIYTVTLWVYDVIGNEFFETKTNYITVTGPIVPVVADFSGSATYGYQPFNVFFTDLSLGSPDTWLWDFGDGNTSILQNPSHLYTVVGIYTVSLTASRVGSSDTLVNTNYITVIVSPTPSGNVLIGVQSGKIVKSIDNGSSWIEVLSYSGVASVCYISDSTLFAITSNGKLLKSIDSGSSWSLQMSLIYSGATGEYITYCGNDTLFVVGNNACYLSTNLGVSWVYKSLSRYTGKNEYGGDDTKATAKCISLGGGILIAAGSTGGNTGSTARYSIQRSTNYGSTWTNIEKTFYLNLSTDKLCKGQISDILDLGEGVILATAPTRWKYHINEWTYYWSEYIVILKSINYGASWGIIYSPGQTSPDRYGTLKNCFLGYVTANKIICCAVPNPGSEWAGVHTLDVVSSNNGSSWTLRSDDSDLANLRYTRATKFIIDAIAIASTSDNGANAGIYKSSSPFSLITSSYYPTQYELFIESASIVADFTSDLTEGESPLNVNFTDTSTGSPDSWLWDFGDGHTSTLQNPTHIFAAGTYTVNLTITKGINTNTNTKINYITCLHSNFSTITTLGNADLTVNFIDMSEGNITSWLWDFGDGHTSSDQNPTHIYTDAGIYTVSLTSYVGLISNIRIKINYITVNLVSDFSANFTSGIVNLTVDFTDLSLGNPDTWFWNFGDGSTSTLQNPTHVYSIASIYTVILTISRGSFNNIKTKIDYITVRTNNYVYDNKYFGTYGVPQENDTGLNFANDFTIDSSNYIYICDTKNLRIVKLNSNLEFIDKYQTTYEPYNILFHNSSLYIVGIQDNLFIKIEKISTSLTQLKISGILHDAGKLFFHPTGISPGFSSDSFLISGACNDLFETIESTNFSSFTPRIITGSSSRFMGISMHSNGFLYLNSGTKIVKVNSLYNAAGQSNFISHYLKKLKISSKDNSLIVYNVDEKSILRYNEELTFVEVIFKNAGSTIDVDAYDIEDFIEIVI